MPIPISISAFGVDYPSVRNAAAAFGIPESTLRRRLAVGFDVEVALAAPANKCRRPAFVGLDNHSYYRTDGKFIDNVEMIGRLRPDLSDAFWSSKFHHHYNPFQKKEDANA